MVLGTDNIDFRIRRSSNAEADFLRAIVSGTGVGVTYADLDAAPSVLLVGLEPEEESPIIFLRLRAATRRGSLQVISVAPYASPGSAKLSAHVMAAAPGQEPAVLRSLAAGDGAAAGALAAQGSVILVGERAAQSPGTLAEVVALAEASGARLAWVPRRAGERGALEAGALPGLLPWGRPLNDPDARAQVAAAWGMDAADLPVGGRARPGRSRRRADPSGRRGAVRPSRSGAAAEGEPAPAEAELATDAAESEPAADAWRRRCRRRCPRAEHRGGHRGWRRPGGHPGSAGVPGRPCRARASSLPWRPARHLSRSWPMSCSRSA